MAIWQVNHQNSHSLSTVYNNWGGKRSLLEVDFMAKGASTGYSNFAWMRFAVPGLMETFLLANTRLMWKLPESWLWYEANTSSPFVISTTDLLKSTLQVYLQRKSISKIKESLMSASTKSQKYFRPPIWNSTCFQSTPSMLEFFCAFRNVTWVSQAPYFQPSLSLGSGLMTLICAALSMMVATLKLSNPTGTIRLTPTGSVQSNCRIWG